MSPASLARRWKWAALGVFSREGVEVYLTLGHRSLELLQPWVAAAPGGASRPDTVPGRAEPWGRRAEGPQPGPHTCWQRAAECQILRGLAQRALEHQPSSWAGS